MEFAGRPTKKRWRKRKDFVRDEMSHLPDDILVRIISLLPLKEAARTSVLSKRWTNIWTNIDRLDFDPSQIFDRVILPWGRSSTSKEERRNYVKWVNKVLQVHKGLTLEEFRICFSLTNSSRKHIDEWIEKAFALRVKRLEVDLLHDSSSRVYTFEKILMGNGFMFLRELCFKFVNVSGDVLEFFIYECPFLQVLSVHGSRDLIELQVFGPSLALKCLNICHCVNLESIILRDILLVSLGIIGVKNLHKKVFIENSPMLIDVTVSHICYASILNDAIHWLSQSVAQLEVLTLFLSEVEEEAEVVWVCDQLTGLRLLILEIDASKDRSLMGITSLIRASPKLEVFVVKLNWLGNPKRRKRKLKKGISFPLNSIKMVEFDGYYGGASDLELINYFLENAGSLEKIIIDPYNSKYLHFPPRVTNIIEEQRIARSYAQRQLEGIIPPHVELVIL